MEVDVGCYEGLYDYRAAWFLRDVYTQNLGIVHNIMGLKQFDVQETNIYSKIQNLHTS